MSAGAALPIPAPTDRRLLALICLGQMALIALPPLTFGPAGGVLAVLAALSAAAMVGSLTKAMLYLCLVSAVLPSTVHSEVLRLPGNLAFVEALFAILLALTGAAWLSAGCPARPRTALDRPAFLFLGLVVFSCGLGLFYGQSTSQMLRDVRYPLYYGLFFVAGAHFDLRRRGAWVPLVLAFSAVVGVEYLFEFLGVLNLSIRGAFVRVARSEGLLLPIGTLLAASIWLFEPRAFRKLLAGVALLPTGIALLATVGRGMWIATLAGLGALGLLVLFDRPGEGRTRRLLILAAVPAFVLGAGYLFEETTGTGVGSAAARKVARTGTPERDHSISSRLISYGVALQAIRERPVLGGGHGATVSFPVTDTEVPHVLTTGAVDNVYLTLALRTGLVGVAAFLWLYGRGLRIAFGAFRRSEAPRDRLLFAGFVSVYTAMLVYGLADPTLVYNRLIFLHAVFLALVARTAQVHTAKGA